MKKAQERVEEGLHPIENEKRPRVVHKKKGGLRLKSKYHRRIVKVLASFSVAAVLCLGVFGVNALFFQSTAPNVVDEGFATVSYELPNDGSTPDMHSALENIGYMNTRLMGQPNYYAEMHGLVDTMIKQEVSTYKQYDDSVLIQTDITTSSMVNSARQFCYVGDRVIWRDAAGGPSTYNGIDTEWKSGEPYGNMMISDYKAKNGLPGTSFSVYVINEETLLDADPVVVNGDGTYTQTFYLDPATDKAPAYYVNQMMFTGGLTALPTFEQIAVTYTFDSTWQVLQSVIDEKYTATMGVSVGCTASYTTDYEYGTEKAVSDAYETYYKNYADKPATGAPEGSGVTAAACLSNAFAPVLSGPVNFALDLTIDGAPVSGIVYVDASDMANLQLRAQLGSVFVQYAGEQIYLRYGEGVKGKATIDEILSLAQSFLSDGEGTGAGLSLDTDALLEQLGGGDFAVAEDGRSATLDSELSMMGFTIPVHFRFAIAEDGAITLDYLSSALDLNGTDVSVKLAYTDETVPEVTDGGEYVSLVPYVQNVLELIDGGKLAVGIDYKGGGFALGGELDLDFTDKQNFAVNGALTLTLGRGENAASKTIGIAYKNKNVYLNLDGVKVKANAEEAVALIMQFIGDAEVSLGDFDLGEILSTALSDEFAQNIALSEKENALEIAFAGNELLKALGIDLGGVALGDVTLGVSDGKITANVLGADISVTEGAAVAVDTEGYTDLMPLVNTLVSLFAENGLSAEIGYSAGNISLGGTVELSLAPFAVRGDLTLSYQDEKGSAAKTLSFAYGADEYIYLALEGAKMKLNAGDAADLVTSALGGQGNADLSEMLMQLFSLTWGDVLAFKSESEVLVSGTELLEKLGIDFDLGDVTLTVKDGDVFARALGASVALRQGKAFALDAADYAGYSDITPVLDTLAAALKGEAVSLGGTLNLAYGETEIALAIENGVISWADGFRLSLDLVLSADGTAQKLSVYADERRVKVVYGNVGVDLVYADLHSVGEAFGAVYARIAGILNQSVSGAALPATIEELSDRMQTGEAVTELLASVDLPKIINSIVFGAPVGGGFASLVCGDSLFMELSAQDGALSCVLSKADFGSLNLSGSLTVGKAVSAPTEPEGDYMTADSFVDLLDFVGASVATLASDDVRLSFTDSKTVFTETGKTKFDIVGELTYHAGTAENGEPFFKLDTENKTLTANPNAYLYFKIWLDEKAADGTDLYLEFWMFDYYTGNTPDGELDFFVSLSKYMPYLDGAGNPTLDAAAAAKSNPAYKPLNFAVSASDILTLAASGVSLVQDTLEGFLASLGIEDSSAVFAALDDYFVSKWLTEDEKGQLGAIGAMLASTLGLDSAFQGLLGDVSDAIAGDINLTEMSFDYYLTKLGISEENGETVFTIALDSDLVYGGSGLEDLTLTFRKAGAFGQSYLTGISLGNIYGNGNSERTSVNFAVSRDSLALDRTAEGVTLRSEETQLASLSYGGYSNYIFAGADELIKSIALSATHKTEEGTYALNERFHISGKAALSLLGIYDVEVTVHGLSVAVDAEDGSVSANAKISFPRVMPLGSIFPVIEQGGTTELTVKGEMVYMRRTLSDGKVTHNAVTTDTFLSTILEQMGYILNLSDTVMDQMQSGGTGGSGGGSKSDDYGTILSNVLNKYSYTAGETGNTWALTMNGSALSGGVLSDIIVTLTSQQFNGQNNVLRGLSVSTSIPLIGNSGVTISADLTFDNPCGVAYDDQTTDISDEIPDLYTVTLIAPESLGGKWAAVEDGEGNTLYYARTVQMFAGSEIIFAYGDESTVFTVAAGENVFDLRSVKVPENICWEDGSFAYTAEGGSVEIALTRDYAVYKSTVAFTWENAAEGAQPVTEDTVGFYKQYALATPVAEGYTFLGWFMQDENGNLTKVTELSYSGTGGKTVEVEAMWTDFQGTMSSRGTLGFGNYKYTVTSAVTGGTLYASFADQLNGSSVMYYFSASKDAGESATVGGSYSASSASPKGSFKTGLGNPGYIHASVVIEYSLENGQTLVIEMAAHGKNTYNANTNYTASATFDVGSVTFR